MKRLTILAVVLAMVVAAAIPALAQDNERDADDAGGHSGGSVVANTTPSDGGPEYDKVAFNADPAPADGGSEIPVTAPADGSATGSGYAVSVPGPTGDSESTCSDADKIALRSAPASDEGGSIRAASTPGCSSVVVEE